MVFGALGPAPTAGTLLPPPQNFHGEVRGYQEPSRAKQTGQYKTRQDSPQGQTDRTGHDDRRARQTRQDIPQWQRSPPGPDRQDRTSHRNQKPSWAGSEAEASSGHDQESGALTGSLSDRLHFSNKGAGGSSCCGHGGHSSRLPQTSLHGQDKTW